MFITQALVTRTRSTCLWTGSRVTLSQSQRTKGVSLSPRTCYYNQYSMSVVSVLEINRTTLPRFLNCWCKVGAVTLFRSQRWRPRYIVSPELTETDVPVVHLTIVWKKSATVLTKNEVTKFLDFCHWTQAEKTITTQTYIITTTTHHNKKKKKHIKNKGMGWG